MADDYTPHFNTYLNPIEERQFQVWLREQSAKRGKDLSRDLYDYDMRGYWKSGSWKGQAPEAHGTDLFKKPNHPTFSEESIYHGVLLPDKVTIGVGGKWWDGVYMPSKTNLKFYPQDQLMKYFQEVEPKIKLKLQ